MGTHPLPAPYGKEAHGTAQKEVLGNQIGQEQYLSSAPLSKLKCPNPVSNILNLSGVRDGQASKDKRPRNNSCISQLQKHSILSSGVHFRKSGQMLRKRARFLPLCYPVMIGLHYSKHREGRRALPPMGQVRRGQEPVHPPPLPPVDRGFA